MIKNYVKIAWRNILKNKIFSLINIFGLAVSMSVAILLISLAHDMMQYDEFHVKKDSIYRVITAYKSQDGYTVNLATSSALAGRKIKAEIPVVEDMAVLHYGFGGEFQTEKKKVEMQGFLAEPSLFNVFSFKLLAGDPMQALKQPNSIVLTERSAKKFFGDTNPMGKTIVLNNNDNKVFIVTGIVQDIPKFSHMQFDALGSLSTISGAGKNDGNLQEWTSPWSDYTYILLRKGSDPQQLQRYLNQLSERENQQIKEKKESVSLYLQPLTKIAFGKKLDNQVGPNISSGMFWFIVILSVIVLLSACFNYTNLSIGRSLTRSKEVGMRKVMGANKRQVFLQLIVEAITISLIALLLGVVIFELIRPYFLSLSPKLSLLLNLELDFPLVIWFICLALLVGAIAGLLPGLFYTKMNVVHIIKSITPFKKTRQLSLKNVLITFQFTISLLFITAVAITFKQYKNFISFDLGFNTSGILNIKLQGNNAQRAADDIARIPGITALSKSFMITSIGSNYYTWVKYNSPDSSMAWYNKIDDQYIRVLELKLIAGRNFNPRSDSAKESEVIVNEKLAEKLNPGNKNPATIIGEFLEIEGEKLQIVGVIKDFHHNTVEGRIKPFLFRHASNRDIQHINARVSSKDIPSTMIKLNECWNKIDPFHPLKAQFYDESIQQAYSEYSSMIKITGYLSSLTIVIASLGLFGMVIISAESRRKEISIRKVFGANTINLMYLLGKSFVVLLIIAGLLAIPFVYIVFDRIVLSDVAYHAPIGFTELFAGFVAVFIIAVILIMSQTFRVAAANPAKVLRNE